MKNRLVSLLILTGILCLLAGCNKTPDMAFSNISYLEDEEIKNVIIGEGKKTVIHFYASWCGDCRREMPDANTILSQSPEEIRVYYLTDDNAQKKAMMEEKYQIPFPTYELSKSLKENGINYIPLTYFIDENGKQVIAQAEQIDWHSQEIKTFLGYN